MPAIALGKFILHRTSLALAVRQHISPSIEQDRITGIGCSLSIKEEAVSDVDIVTCYQLRPPNLGAFDHVLGFRTDIMARTDKDLVRVLMSHLEFFAPIVREHVICRIQHQSTMSCIILFKRYV